MGEGEGTSGAALVDVKVDGELVPGTRIGDKYLIHRLLGVGGTSAVYEAEHLSLGRRVAIKVLDERYGRRADVLARVLREARTAGSVRHANIADVYDVGELEGERPFLVMEMLDGDSLDVWLQRGLLPIESVLGIARQTLAGLAALHKSGVVHRDVKPHNIVLVPGPAGGLVVKLVDFGISKPLTEAAASPSITLEGQLIGTPHYMAPEQLRSEEIDVRADVYAVGVLVYEAITRELPFDRPSIPELSAAVLRDSFPPPRALRPDCPEALEQIVLRAMSRDRNARFSDARAMADALTDAFGPPMGPLEIVFSAGVPQNRGSKRTPSHMATLSPPGAEFARLRSTFPPDRAVMSPLRRALVPYTVLGGMLLGAVGLAFVLRGGSGSPTLEAAQRARAVEVPSSVEQTHAVSRITARAPLSSDPVPTSTGAADAATPAGPSTHVEHDVGTDDAIAPLALADAHRARGQSSRATRSVPLVRAAEAAMPDAVEPSAGRGRAGALEADAVVAEALGAYMRGQFPQARALYLRATVLAPRNTAAWRGLGLVAARLGQRRDATRAFERYLALAPAAPDAARIRAQLEQLGSAPP